MTVCRFRTYRRIVGGLQTLARTRADHAEQREQEQLHVAADTLVLGPDKPVRR